MTVTSAENRTLGITRVFDAPVALVWKAWTEPEHLKKWYGPDGFKLTIHQFDFKPGGKWKFIMHGPDGRDYPNSIVFDEIIRHEKIVYHHTGEGEPVTFITTVTFDETKGKTKLSMSALFESAEDLARVIEKYGADEGMKQTIGRLAEALTTLISE